MTSDPTDPGSSSTQPSEAELIEQLVRLSGGEPEDLSSKLVSELIQAATKLLRDKADQGELKLFTRSFKELRYALKIFRKYRDSPKISVFGSARTPADHPDYDAAREFSQQLAQAGWMVITGAGDGIMLAGHEGAGAHRSFGVSIRLPFETQANRVITGDQKLITFRYFFTRKLVFVSQAQAVALFPGGFGTLDEGFEVLTLIQTGKADIVPVVFIDAPGGDYWQQWDQYVRDQLLAKGMISPEDLNLYLVTDDVNQAAEHVKRFYRNYHSQRFVGDWLVLRLRRPLSESALAALNDEFSDLLAEGTILQSGPMEDEGDELADLPRLRFVFKRGRYGRLRLLIDRVNAL